MKQRPKGVFIVAIIFAIIGCTALADIISRLRENGTFHINIGIIFLPVSCGILFPRLYVRMHALILSVLLGLYSVSIAICVITGFLQSDNSTSVSLISPLLTSALALAASIWGVRFLSSPEAKNFYPSTR